MLHDLSDNRLRCLQIHLGGDRNFCYLLGDPGGRAAAAVDPGFDPEGLARIAAEADLDIVEILITHGHADHVDGAEALAAATGARVRQGAPRTVAGSELLEDGLHIEVGGMTVTALATPGHAPDHFCFQVGGRLVTGDLLFCGKVGGTGSWFPGSDAQAEWESLQRILTLPAATIVLPGHDYYGGEGVMTHSTIGHEAATNPFLMAGDPAAFQHLKDNWAAWKKAHGIR